MVPLTRTPTLDVMAGKWRLCLVAIVAAAVLGGVMPHAMVAGTDSAGSELAQVASTPLPAPLDCLDATCGKGTPASPAPAPAVALVAVMGGLAALAVAGSWIRRRRMQPGALPAGARRAPFHPPQFS